MTEEELEVTALGNCHSKECLKVAALEEKGKSHGAIAACASEQLSDVLGLQRSMEGENARQASGSSWILCNSLQINERFLFHLMS